MCNDCMKNTKQLLILAVLAVAAVIFYKKGIPQKLIGMVTPTKQIP